MGFFRPTYATVMRQHKRVFRKGIKAGWNFKNNPELEKEVIDLLSNMTYVIRKNWRDTARYIGKKDPNIKERLQILHHLVGLFDHYMMKYLRKAY